MKHVCENCETHIRLWWFIFYRNCTSKVVKWAGNDLKGWWVTALQVLIIIVSHHHPDHAHLYASSVSFPWQLVSALMIILLKRDEMKYVELCVLSWPSRGIFLTPVNDEGSPLANLENFDSWEPFDITGAVPGLPERSGGGRFVLLTKSG